MHNPKLPDMQMVLLPIVCLEQVLLLLSTKFGLGNYDSSVGGEGWATTEGIIAVGGGATFDVVLVDSESSPLRCSTDIAILS